MKLGELYEVQSAGALKIGSDCSNGNIVVGGSKLTADQCKQLVKALGWLNWDKPDWEVIDKTDKFIRGIKPYVTDEDILANTEVTFQNRRISDTLKYFDRIKMVGSDFDITILYRMPGTGGTYAVYDDSDNFRKPQFTCRSAKQLGEYINGTE